MIKPTKQDHLIVHKLDDEMLLYDPDVDRSHRLNVSATFVWRYCDGQHTVEEIAQLLMENFEVDLDVALRDSQETIQKMADENLLARAAE